MKHLKVEASYKIWEPVLCMDGWTSFVAVDNRPKWIAEVKGKGYNEGVASLLCVYYYT
jgi:hypothetical protein